MTSMMGNTGMVNRLKGTGYSVAQVPTMNAGQNQLMSQSLEDVGPNSFIRRLSQGDPALFEQLEAPAFKQFAGLQGNIASRFSGMGIGGRHSSGFQNTMNQASSDFAQALQSQRLGLQTNAWKDLMNASNMLLGQRS